MLTNQPPNLINSRLYGADSETELFIVEGDSAAQAVAKHRDGQLQAVLPMQGKPLNPSRVTQEKLLENVWYAALIKTIGCGIGEQCQPAKRRYGSIIILMDPDADGIHCGALLTLFFYLWMRPLLEAGVLHMVRPPVGQFMDQATGKVTFAYTQTAFRQGLKQNQSKGDEVIKYRGLAGIPSEHLEALCIHPVSRKQLLLSEKDAEMVMQVFN